MWLTRHTAYKIKMWLTRHTAYMTLFVAWKERTICRTYETQKMRTTSSTRSTTLPSLFVKITGHLFCEITKSTDALVQEALSPLRKRCSFVRSLRFCFLQNCNCLKLMTGKSDRSGMWCNQNSTCSSSSSLSTQMCLGSMSSIEAYDNVVFIYKVLYVACKINIQIPGRGRQTLFPCLQTVRKRPQYTHHQQLAWPLRFRQDGHKI